ncbi:MAG: FIST C-terminal domain-containing protein [Myxococcota bacterium]|nr:FIST C-terminal domain-containing protein [Myxococcota bacterium]
MVRAGSGISTIEEPAAAAREACEAALAQAEAARAEGALLFATHALADPRTALAEAVEVLGTRAVVGAAADAVLAGGFEETGRPAIAVLVLADADVEPFLLADLAGAEDAAGLEIEAHLAGSAVENDLIAVFTDPLAFDARRLLQGLGETLAPAALVGAGGTLGEQPGGLQWCGRELATGAAAGLVVRSPVPPRPLVVQGCRPITPPLEVTRSEGLWVLELDGRPALEVYCEVARDPLAADLQRAARHLVFATPPPGARSAGEVEFVARGVSGFAESGGGLALAEPLRPGTRVRLALRDADLAREDLKRALEGVASRSFAGALYLSCAGRGHALFGHEGLEPAYVEQALAPAPVAGLFGAYQIASLGGRPALHTYAGVLAGFER